MPEVSADTSIQLNWLRESEPGHLEADLGLPLNGDSLPLALMAIHPLQHCEESDANRIHAQLETGLRSVESFERLPQWLRQRLKTFFGPLVSQAQLDHARHNLHLTRQVCDFIVRKAAQADGAVELHLPYFGRKAWLHRFDRLSELTFDLSPDGRMIERPAAERPVAHGASQMATALAPAFKKTTGASFAIALQDRRRTTAENARVALDQVLSDYGLAGALDGHAGETEIALTVRVPAEACNAWIGTPNGRTADFTPIYSRFSAGIQMALRRWLGWFYFAGGNRYGELNTAYAMLAYQVTRPYVAETRSAFAYDVLDETRMAALCRAAGRRLPGKLALVEAYLRRTGQTHFSGMYAPGRAGEVANWLKKDARVYPSLLAGDGSVVDEALKLAQRFSLCLRARQFSGYVDQFVASFDRKLRAVMRRCGVFDAAPPVLLAEVIGAMSLARGGPAPELVAQISSETKTSTHRNSLTRWHSLSSM